MKGLLENGLTNLVAETIGWTIVHFTWQALIVGLAVCLGLRALPQHVVRIRYSLCCLGLSVLTLTPIATCVYLTHDVRAVSASKEPDSGVMLESSADARRNQAQLPFAINYSGDWNLSLDQPDAALMVGRRTGTTGAQEKAVQPWMLWLVIGWLCGVGLLTIRTLGGLLRIRVWKDSAKISKNRPMVETFEQLCDRMEIRSAQLLESTRTYVPTVVGWLRPIVLVPSSLAAGLAPAELELILAHELAHVRRHDYLVNLMQNLLETLLFFHPVVWWLSNQTRIEREYCCDELAMEVCGDRATLAWALTKLEESRSTERLMVAASGGSLANRVRRILQKDSGASSWPAGAGIFFVAATLFACITISSAFAMDAPPTEPQTLSAVATPSASIDEKDPKGEEEKSAEEPDFATRMTQVRRKDSKTGNEKSVFVGIRLLSGDRQFSQEMIYSNIFNYSFISERVVKELKLEVLGEVDFLDHAPNKAERFGPKPDLVVNQVTEPVGDRVVRPYQTDSVWIPGHLGFYGMNKSKQHVFKIVRLPKVDLGIGPPLQDVNLLVLEDSNSDFGVIGRDLTKRLSRQSGKSVMFSADGEMWLQPKKPSSDQQTKLPKIREVESDGAQTKRAVIDSIKQTQQQRRSLLLAQDEIARSQGMQPGKWSTSFETLVSALVTKWSPTELEAAEVTLNVPENTGLRVAFSGEKVEIQTKQDHSVVTVQSGQIDLIDPGGVIRARATPAGEQGRLVARVGVISDESVLTIQAQRFNSDPAQVHVRLTTDTGASETDDVPHGGVRYKLELPKKANEQLRMRLATRENLERLRRELNGEEKPKHETSSEAALKIMELLSKSPGKQQVRGVVNDSPWGPAAKAGDLRVRLSLVTKQPKVGQPLRFKLELKNFGDKAQDYDPQYYSAFRVLQVTNTSTGKSDESLGMSFQTMGGKVPLAPGESVTLWENADAAELFMLDEGTYKIQVAAPQIRNGTLPKSNELTVKVAAGRQTAAKRLMRALEKLAPKGWDVSIGWQQRVYLTHKPTRYKSDATTIQLWTSKEPQAESELGPNATEIGKFEAGRAYLSASENATALWPNYAKQLSDATRRVLQEK